jgi:hypothetical protein
MKIIDYLFSKIINTIFINYNRNGIVIYHLQ